MSTAIKSKDDIVIASKEQDWNTLWLVLLTHTIKRLRYRYGIREKNDEIKIRARTQLSEVMHLILVEGTRNWNTDRYLTFQDFVISVIDSQLSNTFSKSPPREEATDDFQDTRSSSGIEADILYKDLKDKVFAILQEEKSTDEELLVFECMADGIVKPIHIRSELGIDEVEFRRIWRNLEPKLEKIRKSLESNG